MQNLKGYSLGANTPFPLTPSGEQLYFLNQFNNASIWQLLTWYIQSTGLWTNSSWWQSANALTALTDYAINYNANYNTPGEYANTISNTYSTNSSTNFDSTNFTDDEGWWALAWLRAYELTGISTYLTAAKTVHTDMTTFWDTTCSGGVWWQKSPLFYKNAIANELFWLLSARLYGITGTTSYDTWATNEANWFLASGMINSQNLVNDGLNSSCVNNGNTTWTYNQGVILGALAQMYLNGHGNSYLTTGIQIADAAIANLTTPNGILSEPTGTPDNNNSLFKGIFVRNLAKFAKTIQQVNPSKYTSYKNFVTANALSLINADSTLNNYYAFGFYWQGPVDSTDFVRQTAAADLLNAAILLSS